VTKITSLDDLDIYQESLQLTRLIYSLTKSSKLNQDFSLRDQLRRASLSVTANIAEGFGRKTKKDFSQFLSVSLGSANETIAYLDFIHLEYQLDVQMLKSRYNLLCKRIFSFRRYLSNHYTYYLQPAISYSLHIELVSRPCFNDSMALTTKDLQQIKNLIDTSIQSAIQANNTVLLKAIFDYTDQRFAQIESVMATKDDIKHLPTKEEFYAKEDALMTELQSLRQTVEVSSSQISEHGDRLNRMESHLGLNQ